MEIPSSLRRGSCSHRNDPSPQFNRRQYDETSSSSDSSSSPPRKRSWKKLHRRKAHLVLGRKNYLEPSLFSERIIKQNPQSTPESSFPGTSTTSTSSQDVCKSSPANRDPFPSNCRNEKSLPLATLTEGNNKSFHAKDISPNEINLRLSQSTPCTPSDRYMGRIEGSVDPHISRDKKAVSNGPNDSRPVLEGPNLKKDETPLRHEFGLKCPRQSKETQIIREVKHAVGSKYSLGNNVKKADVSHLPSPTVKKNGLERQFVDRMGLVILLRNDLPCGVDHSTSRLDGHLETEDDCRNGVRQDNNSSSSLFEGTAENDCNLSNKTFCPPCPVTVTCHPLPSVSAIDRRFINAQNTQNRKQSSINLTSHAVDKKPGKNISNATRTDKNGSSSFQFLRQNTATNHKNLMQSVSIQAENDGHLVERDLYGVNTQYDASRPKSVQQRLDTTDGDLHRVEVAQPDVSNEAHPNDDSSLQMLINRLSVEDSGPRPELDSLNIVNFGSANTEKYCKLSFCKPFNLSCLLHAQHCNLVAEGIAMRKKCDNLWQTIPDIDEKTLDFVFGSTCREFFLENQCSNNMCLSVHSVKLEPILTVLNGASVFKMFLRWFDANSKQLNFKVLKSLLSLLHVGFCGEDDLRTLLLSISRFILRIRKNFQHPLALTILNKMATLLRVPYHEAARLILVFAVTHTTESARILDLFFAMGALEMNKNHLFVLVSSVWHLNSNVVFPSTVVFRVLTLCLERMPEQFVMVRDKIVLQMVNLPRSDVLKNFSNIDRFLIKFFPTNSKLVFYFRDVQIRGKNPESVDRIAWTDAYHTSRVKPDDINPSWQYWDVGENRRNGFHAVVGNSKREYPTDPLGPTRSEDLASTELDVDVEADGIALWTRLDTLPETDRAIQELSMFEGAEKYEKLIKTLAFLGNFYNKNLLDYTLGSLYNMFVDMGTELPSAIDRVLKALPQHSLYSNGPRMVRKSFISTVNTLVVKFYQQRKFEYALTLIKIMQTSGENPFQYGPQNMDDSLFEIVCSHIHLECLMVKDAVQILLHSKCMNSTSPTVVDGSPFIEHFRLLEMLVFKLLKHCLAARQSLYALNVFRGVVKAQNSLTFPINIHRYYEPVLCSTFSTNARASNFLCHEGANLYVLVDRLCGNATKFHPMTYRSILVALHDADVSQDIVRRTLQCCIRANAYPMFKSDCILLSCHLTTEEMHMYIRHFLQFFLHQSQFGSVFSRPLLVRLMPVKGPLSSPYLTTESISVVSTALPDSVCRLKKAFELLAGVDFSELEAEFKMDSEFVLPEATVKLLVGIVQT